MCGGKYYVCLVEGDCVCVYVCGGIVCGGIVCVSVCV